MNKTCVSCGKSLSEEAEACPQCGGSQFREDPPVEQAAPCICPICGKALTVGVAFCPSCGHPYGAPPQMPPQAPPMGCGAPPQMPPQAPPMGYGTPPQMPPQVPPMGYGTPPQMPPQAPPMGYGVPLQMPPQAPPMGCGVPLQMPPQAPPKGCGVPPQMPPQAPPMGYGAPLQMPPFGYGAPMQSMAPGRFVSRKEFIEKYSPATKRSITVIAVLCYVCAGLSLLLPLLLNFFIFLDIVNLSYLFLEVASILGLALGMHLGKSRGCAIALFVFSIVESRFSLFSGTVPIVLLGAGISALVTFNSAQRQYRQFLYGNAFGYPMF